MKGALLKEFYIWRKTGLLYVLLYIVLGALSFLLLDSVSAVLLGLMAGMTARPFMEDDKNGWTEYSRALPYSVVHCVSARYIIILAEMLIALTVLTVLSITPGQGNDVVLKIAEYFPYMDLKHISTVTSVLNVFALLTGLAFSIPLHYLIKGQKRTLVGGFPLLIAIAFVIYLNFSYALSYYFPSQNITLMKIMYYEKWVLFVIAAITVLLLVLSWIVSIVINTNSGKEKLNKIKVLAVVITLVIVGASVVSVGILYKNGRFEIVETDYTQNLVWGVGDNDQPGTQQLEEPKEPTAGQLECREDVIELIENFFKESHIDFPLENTKKQLESLGYTETEHGSGKFYSRNSEDGKVSVELSRYDNIDGVKTVYISADIGTFYIEKATKRELDKIASNFSKGMTEDAMIEKFKELKVAPQYVREYIHPNFGLTRYYCLEYKVLEYNGGESTVFSINLDVIDGVVQDLRTYDY